MVGENFVDEMSKSRVKLSNLVGEILKITSFQASRHGSIRYKNIFYEKWSKLDQKWTWFNSLHVFEYKDRRSTKD